MAIRIDAKELLQQLMGIFARHWAGEPELVRRVLREAIYTPACGLAFHTITDAEFILESLIEFHDYCKAMVIESGS